MSFRFAIKRSLSILLFSCAWLQGCREKGSSVILQPAVSTADTTYVAAVETPQLRNVLVEELTGVSCPPCPQGHADLKFLQGKYPGRVIVLANHVFGFPQANPVSGASKGDFRTQEATDLFGIFGGVPFMPAALIDRVPDAQGGYTIPRSAWFGSVDARIAVAAPVNLSITKTWEEQSRTVQARVKLAYTSAVSAKHNMTIAVIESDLVDAQKYPTEIDTFYTHNHILRDIVTPTVGTAVLDSIGTKQAGRIFDRSISITLKPEWNADNCKIVAFVHYADATDRSVLQAVETEVK